MRSSGPVAGLAAFVLALHLVSSYDVMDQVRPQPSHSTAFKPGISRSSMSRTWYGRHDGRSRSSMSSKLYSRHDGRSRSSIRSEVTGPRLTDTEDADKSKSVH